MSKKKEALSEALLRHFRYETVAVIHSAFEDSPRTVALVNVDKSWSKNKKLEKAFMLTNTIDAAWYMGDKVNYIGPDKSCRSTSVGDFVLIGKTKYECKPAGWSKVAYLKPAHDWSEVLELKEAHEWSKMS